MSYTFKYDDTYLSTLYREVRGIGSPWVKHPPPPILGPKFYKGCLFTGVHTHHRKYTVALKVHGDHHFGHQNTYARFTIADPTPRLCPDAVGSANVNGFPTRQRLLGPHRETIGRSSADREPNVYNATVFQREL